MITNGFLGLFSAAVSQIFLFIAKTRHNYRKWCNGTTGKAGKDWQYLRFNIAVHHVIGADADTIESCLEKLPLCLKCPRYGKRSQTKRFWLFECTLHTYSSSEQGLWPEAWSSRSTIEYWICTSKSFSWRRPPSRSVAPALCGQRNLI